MNATCFKLQYFLLPVSITVHPYSTISQIGASSLNNADLSQGKCFSPGTIHLGANRHRFGSTSEALDQLQLSLEKEEIVVAAEEIVTPQPEVAEPKGKPRRKPLPEHLDRNQQILSPGEECSKCGGDLKKLCEDVTEELEYVPGRFIANRRFMHVKVLIWIARPWPIGWVNLPLYWNH